MSVVTNKNQSASKKKFKVSPSKFPHNPGEMMFASATYLTKSAETQDPVPLLDKRRAHSRVNAKTV